MALMQENESLTATSCSMPSRYPSDSLNSLEHPLLRSSCSTCMVSFVEPFFILQTFNDVSVTLMINFLL